MNQRELILAAMAPSHGKEFSPVQIQKLVFLIEENLAVELGGKQFAFKPYNYGPFDKQVYKILEQLEEEGQVVTIPSWNWSNFKLTLPGQGVASQIFADLPEKVQAYITEVVEFVLGLSFEELVSAVYKAYPQMRANSVFKD